MLGTGYAFGNFVLNNILIYGIFDDTRYQFTIKDTKTEMTPKVVPEMAANSD